MRICYTRFLGAHHLCGGKGERARRSEGEQREQQGAKRSEAYHILGFRVPTTSVG